MLKERGRGARLVLQGANGAEFGNMALTCEGPGKGRRCKRTFQRKRIFPHKDIFLLGKENQIFFFSAHPPA